MHNIGKAGRFCNASVIIRQQRAMIHCIRNDDYDRNEMIIENELLKKTLKENATRKLNKE